MIKMPSKSLSELDIYILKNKVKYILRTTVNLSQTADIIIKELYIENDQIHVKGEYQEFLQKGEYDIVFDLNMKPVRIKVKPPHSVI